MNNSYTYSTPSTSIFDWAALSVPMMIMMVVLFCSLLIGLIVFIKFVIMLDDVRKIRTILEDRLPAEAKITIDDPKNE